MKAIEKKDDKKSKEGEQKDKEKELNEYIEKQVSEVQNLGIDQIKQKVKALEAKTSSFKGEINKMKVDIRKFNSRIKENKSKLQQQTGLPHLVSSISEIFDIENVKEEDEGSGLKQNKEQKKLPKVQSLKQQQEAQFFCLLLVL